MEHGSRNELLRCFKCNKIRHIKVDHPFLQYKMKSHHHVKLLYRPIKIENGIWIPKTRSEYTNNDKMLLYMDTKAINTLYYALSISEFNIIISWWKAHEGTNQVKEFKITMLVHQYELFKMFLSEYMLTCLLEWLP